MTDENRVFSGSDGYKEAILKSDSANRISFTIDMLIQYEARLFDQLLDSRMDKMSEYFEFLIWLDKITDNIQG